MKQDYKLNPGITHSYQVLVDGKTIACRQHDETPTLNTETAGRVAQCQHNHFDFSAAEGGRLFHRYSQMSLSPPKREPMNDVCREILRRGIALTCRTSRRVERVLETLLLDEETVPRELLSELGEQLQDILTLFSVLPVSKGTRQSREFTAEQLSTWQFEQLATVLEEVRQANSSKLGGARGQVLQSRVLPWLDSMHRTFTLLHEMLPAQRC